MSLEADNVGLEHTPESMIVRQNQATSASRYNSSSFPRLWWLGRREELNDAFRERGNSL